MLPLQRVVVPLVALVDQLDVRFVLPQNVAQLRCLELSGVDREVVFLPRQFTTQAGSGALEFARHVVRFVDVDGVEVVVAHGLVGETCSDDAHTVVALFGADVAICRYGRYSV
jgi:hypothetical protein